MLFDANRDQWLQVHAAHPPNHAVNPEKGTPILKQTKKILKKYGWKQQVRHPAKGYTMPDHRPEPRVIPSHDPALSSFRQVGVLEKPGPAPEPAKKKKPWWKFWA